MKIAAHWVSTVALPPVGLFLAIVALWQIVAVASGVEAFLVPRPTSVLEAAVERRGDLLAASGRTAGAALCGFALSLAAGTLTGIAFSQSGIVRRSFYPYAIFLQTVPSVALAPLVILWFGPGFASVVVVAFVISLFPIITNSTAGLLAVDRNLLELFEMSNASRLQTLVKLRLPNSIPQIITGAKISSGLSVIGAIVGEFSAGIGNNQFGLGYLILQNNAQLKTAYLFAAVLATMLLGVAIFGTVSLIGESILRLWYAPSGRGSPPDSAPSTPGSH
jgi:NitT/TauT family transport system permease protein